MTPHIVAFFDRVVEIVADSLAQAASRKTADFFDISVANRIRRGYGWHVERFMLIFSSSH